MDKSGQFFQVTHFRDNFAKKVKHDPRTSGCFYTGKVKGDPKSDIAVSLCNGMVSTPPPFFFLYLFELKQIKIRLPVYYFWHYRILLCLFSSVYVIYERAREKKNRCKNSFSLSQGCPFFFFADFRVRVASSETKWGRARLWGFLALSAA